MAMKMKRYLIALDPGQKQDPAAIQIYKAMPEIVHPDPLINQRAKVIYRDDLVMQYKLADKRYTYLADFVVGLMSRKSLSSESVLVFDATGVGAAVKDMLHDRGVKDMIPIVYTAGGKESYVYRDEGDKRFQIGSGNSPFRLRTLDEIRVPKPDLVDAARMELERKAIRIVPKIPYVEEFHTQMMEFRGKMNAKGYVSYNNSKEEIHDEWPNCFMMRSWVRVKFNADMYEEEGEYGANKDVVGLADLMGLTKPEWEDFDKDGGWRR